MTLIRSYEAISSNHRKEDELLLCCIRVFLDPTHSDMLKKLLSEEMDWTYLIVKAQQQGVLPLLDISLSKNCLKAIPDEIQAQIREKFKRVMLANMVMTGELLRILAKFQANDMEAIAFKGPSLAQSLYGGIALRQFGDLDILVHLKDVPRATEMLLLEGYNLPYQLNEKQSSAFLQYAHHHHFYHPKSGITVEIHWRISSSIYSSKLDLDGIWDRSEQITIFGKKILNFSPEDILRVLCEHGARHNWQRLSWICDIAMLIKAKQLNWPDILMKTDTTGSLRAILLGLFLANELLCAPIPDEMLERIKADPELPEMAATVMQGLFPEKSDTKCPEDSIQHEISKMRFCLKATDRFQGRAKGYLRMATTPVVADYELIKLPNLLYPLYFIVRPIRLIYFYRLSIIKWILRQN